MYYDIVYSSDIMKILIFANEKKKEVFAVRDLLISKLIENKIDYRVLSDNDLSGKISGDCLLVLGGDGTVLRTTYFSVQNRLPVIGINGGKLGFLSEFESNELDLLISNLKSKSFKVDERLALCVEFRNQSFVALNDAVVQRIYDENVSGSVTELTVSIEDKKLEKIVGDGVIVGTPTGSTAYSLSAGGAVLAPGINAFSLTPIAAHSLCNRPVIYSADHCCKIKLDGEASAAALFVDGKFISKINKNEEVVIKKNCVPVLFLRKKESDFYDRLVSKLGGNGERK